LLPVVFSIDNSSDSGACTIKLPTVSFTGVGTCVIDANQTGNATYAPAPQVQQTVQVAAAPKVTYATPNPGTSGDCTKARPCSLPDAVAAVGEGGTVLLAGGPYSGVALDLTKSVTLRGEQGAKPVLTGAADDVDVITVESAAAVQLIDLTVTGGNEGINDRSQGAVTVTDSTITGNIDNGVLDTGEGSVTVTDSTITGNDFGGVFIVPSSSSATVTVTSSTITGNAIEGIWNSGTSVVRLGGDIVAGNTENCLDADQVTDLGGNIDSDGSCGLGSGRGSVSGSSTIVDSLKPLADNGGPTETIALKPGSPALGIVPGDLEVDGTVLCSLSDQRGKPRSKPCDAGAYELQNKSVQIRASVSPEPAPYGNVGHYSAIVTGNTSDGAPTGCVTFKARTSPQITLGKDCTPSTSGDSATYRVKHPGKTYPASDGSALHPGSYTIVVNYQAKADSGYLNHSSTLHHTVRTAGVTVTDVAVRPATSDHGRPVRFSASVAPSTLRGLPPTGTVRFYAYAGGHKPAIQTCSDSNLTPSGVGNEVSASCTYSSLQPGSYTVKARYFPAGDNNYNRSKLFGAATLTVNPVANLKVTVKGDANLSQGGNQPARRGNGLVSYTVTVRNSGPDAAKNVTVSDVLPSTATGPRGRAVLAEFVSDDGHCSGEPRPYTASHGQKVSCDLGAIANGKQKSVTFELALFSRSRARSPYAFGFTDTASASSGTFDPDTSNNAGKATLTYRMR
jgi:uncharacterized repeat protein (TIGR01451 family)